MFSLLAISPNCIQTVCMIFFFSYSLATNIEINTVDKVQGREFNAVIFLNDGSALQPGGLNLALTRAKDLLYVAVLCELTTQVSFLILFGMLSNFNFFFNLYLIFFFFLQVTDQFLNLIKNGESRNVVRTLGSQVTHEQILNMVKN